MEANYSHTAPTIKSQPPVTVETVPTDPMADAPLSANPVPADPASTETATGASHNYWLLQQFQPGFNPSDNPLAIQSQSYNISPLGLELAIQKPSAKNDLRQQIDLLEQEVSLRCQGLERRPVHLLTLRDESGALNSSEITELIFFLGHRFNLNHSGQRVYCLQTHPEFINADHLALLKGLGFNRLEFNTDCLIAKDDCNPTDHIRQLRATLELLQEYDFPTPSWVFKYGGQDANLDLQQLDQLLTIKPARIQLVESIASSSAINSESAFEEIHLTLRNQGYRVVGNDCFVIPSHPIAKAKDHHQLRITVGGYNASNVCDWIGIGPGLYSQLNNLYYQNHTDNGTRQSKLANQTLPIAAGVTLSKPEQAYALAIGNLSAYHQIDLDYYNNRYNLKFVSPSLANASTSQNITLNKSDVLNLRAFMSKLELAED